MTVQIQQGRPKDRLNGLPDLEHQLLQHPETTVTAVVTFAVGKVVDDIKRQEEYPVVYMKAIEPILDELEQQAVDLQVLAHSKRTGEETLDFDAPDEDGE